MLSNDPSLTPGSTKFTVVIPTADRCETLYYSLRTATRQVYPHLEILVSDNASQDRTQEVVAEAGDHRVRYVNTGQRVSMTHNFEFALSHVQDGWVCFLGDDDALLPGCLEAIDLIIQTTGSQAISTPPGLYIWPNVKTQGTLVSPSLSLYCGKGYELRNSALAMKQLLNGQLTYTELPMLYTGGFVSMELVNRARCQDGTFFLSRVPDVYSAVALSSVSETFVRTRFPATLSGLSAHSTGSSWLKITDDDKPYKKFQTESSIPYFESLGDAKQAKTISLLVYESYLQAHHLHHDRLAIKMADQLALTLATATNRPDAEAYVASTAGRHGLSLGKIRRRAWFFRLLARIDIRRRLKLWLSLRTIAGAYGALNVLEASCVALSISDRHQEWRRIWRRLPALITPRRR